jgi:hypothetical protein
MNKNHFIREFKDWMYIMSAISIRLRTFNPFKFMHALMNILTETIRALPYTLAHLLVIGLILFGAHEVYEHVHYASFHGVHGVMFE